MSEPSSPSPKPATTSSSASAEGRVCLSLRLRERLQWKRKSLSLSLQDMGHLLSVHWSTYRKWENGETTMVSQARFQSLIDFLSGHYDIYVQSGSAKELRWTRLNHLEETIVEDSALGELLRKLCHAHSTLASDRKLQKLLQQEVNRDIDRVLQLMESGQER